MNTLIKINNKKRFGEDKEWLSTALKKKKL